MKSGELKAPIPISLFVIAVAHLSLMCATTPCTGREIPVKTEEEKRPVGKNAVGQRIYEVERKVLSIGSPDYATEEAAPPFEFNSKNEYICAVNLITKAFSVYGDFAHPRFNIFPEYSKIDTDLSASIRATMYGDLN
jgi:hypothetical protein